MKAKIGDRIRISKKSNAGKEGIVMAVGSAKCTIQYEDGRKGFAFHENYEIIDDVSMQGGNKERKQESANDEEDNEGVTYVVTIEECLKVDAVNIACKVAATTNDVNTARKQITRLMESVEKLTLDLIKKRKQKVSITNDDSKEIR